MNINIKSGSKLALCGALLFLGTGCDDFLKEENLSDYTQENYFTKPEHAESAVNAVYSTLRFMTNGTGTYGESPFMMLEFPTGLTKTDVGQSFFNNELRMLNANADNNYFYVWWRNCYLGIANANLAISRIPDITMDEVTKARLLGEAHFLRAFYYYHLVRIYGDVPLIIEPVDATSPLLYPTRTPQAEVYNQIVNDLVTAEASGLPDNDASGKASLGAVKSLLASVYLTMAGYPLQGGQEYYQMAADKAKEVIDAGWYTLFDDYDALHTTTTENTGEFIFQTQYAVGIATNPVTAFLLPRSRDIAAYSDEFGALYPTPEFYNSYESDDKRAQEQEFYYSEYPAYEAPHNIVQFGGHYIFKFFDKEAVLQTAQSGLNWTLLRYPEVLLIYAEAINEASGSPTAEAYNAVNQIRERADLPELSGLSQQTFREAVWRARYHELAFENKAWFDMIRTRKAYNPTTNTFDDFVGHEFTYGPKLTEKYLLFPIPSREINNNKGLTQNPGW